MRHRHNGTYKSRTPKGHTTFKNRPIHKHINLIFNDGKKRRVPFMEPMRPKPTEEVWEADNIIGEEKKDGSLALQYGYNGTLAYANRRGVDKTEIYPELSDKEKLNTKGLTITQGEVYALKGKKDNFDAFLKRDLLKDPDKAKQRVNKYPLTYEAFDILMKDNNWMVNYPLSKRKLILDRTIPKGLKDVKVVPYFKDTRAFTDKMQKDKTVEGVVYKDLNSLYKSGKQNDWRKLKFRKEADVIFTGYEKGEGKRKGIGALNAGVYDKGKIKEIASVGTGFSDEELEGIKQRLDKGERLFGQVEYLNLGSQGRLRAPSFKGLREDITLRETHI